MRQMLLSAWRSCSAAIRPRRHASAMPWDSIARRHSCICYTPCARRGTTWVQSPCRLTVTASCKPSLPVARTTKNFLPKSSYRQRLGAFMLPTTSSGMRPGRQPCAPNCGRRGASPPGPCTATMGRLLLPDCGLATSSSAFSRHEGLETIPLPSITLRTSSPPIITWARITGCVISSRLTLSCIWGNTARSNGCPARASGCQPPATLIWLWATCP